MLRKLTAVIILFVLLTGCGTNSQPAGKTPNGVPTSTSTQEASTASNDTIQAIDSLANTMTSPTDTASKPILKDTAEGTQSPQAITDEPLNPTNTTQSDFVGWWHCGGALGSGLGERYDFNEDGTFQWAASQMIYTRLLWRKGLWSFANDSLTLTTTDEYWIDGGKVVDSGILIGGKDIDGGEILHITGLNYSESYSVTKPETDEDRHLNFQLGNKGLYNYDNEPGFFDISDIYWSDFENFNPETGRMHLLFFEQKDIDNDGHIETIAAFGAYGNNNNENTINESFILREIDGRLVLVNQGFANEESINTDSLEAQALQIIIRNGKTNVTSPSQSTIPVEGADKYYIFPHSDTQLITDETPLEYMDPFTLRLAKNELFARHGYIFKDKDLAMYFNNMPWYHQNAEFKGELSELNAIEQQNFTLIDSYYQQMNQGSLWTDANSQVPATVLVSKDIDGDGNPENITVELPIFNLSSDPQEDDWAYSGFRLNVESNGKSYSISEGFTALAVRVTFAKFDMDQRYTQIIIQGAFMDDIYYALIYTFDGNKIIENTDLHGGDQLNATDTRGDIIAYDGRGKIFTTNNSMLDENNTYHSYYDLVNGFTPDKDLIVGKYLIYQQAMPIAKQINDETSFTDLLNLPPDYDWKQNFGDNLLTTVPTETRLRVLDVTFETDKNGNVIPWPWVKVQTPDGDVGFMQVFYRS